MWISQNMLAYAVEYSMNVYKYIIDSRRNIKMSCSASKTKVICQSNCTFIFWWIIQKLVYQFPVQDNGRTFSFFIFLSTNWSKIVEFKETIECAVKTFQSIQNTHKIFVSYSQLACLILFIHKIKNTQTEMWFVLIPQTNLQQFVSDCEWKKRNRKKTLLILIQKYRKSGEQSVINWINV